MRLFSRILLSAVFVAAFLLTLSIAASAQELSDYLFLEVIDSKEKPVAEATVETYRQTLKTNEEGKTNFEFSSFKVSKPGYFPFQDLGIARTSYRTTVKIELLKIPQTKAERTSLGTEELKREFMWAVKNGDSEAVRKLLKAGINPNLTTDDLRGISAPKNIPAIIFAATAGDSETINVLLKAGVNVRAPNEQIKNILQIYLWADPFLRHKPKDEADEKEIIRRYEDGVEMLIKAGADINRVISDYDSPLLTAASNGSPRIVKMLLDQGLSANSKTRYGDTVLMKAADNLYGKKNSKVETVKLLLKAGADPNAVKADTYGCTTALMNASVRGDVEAMRVLIENGAKINLRCNGGDSALWRAVNGGSAKAVKYLLETGADTKIFGPDSERILPIAAAKGYTELVKLLIDSRFPIDGKEFGRTALIAALESYEPYPEIVNILLEAGADPNVIVGSNKFKNDCNTPLMISVRTAKPDIVKALIAKKADVKFICRDGRSALTVAMYGQNPIEMVKLLIENGADIKGRQGQFALDYLQTEREIIRNPGEISKLFENAGVKMKPALSLAVEDGQTETVRRLVESGADVNYANARGETLLMTAAAKDFFVIVSILLKKGAAVDARDVSGMTALMYAVEKSDIAASFSPAIIKLLLDAGADVNITASGYNGESSRKTALMIAALQGNLEVIKMLLAKKADLNFDGGDGDSALGIAIRGGNPVAATKLLLESGADVKGKIGQVALKIAKQLKTAMTPNNAFLEVIKLLESAGAKE